MINNYSQIHTDSKEASIEISKLGREPIIYQVLPKEAPDFLSLREEALNFEKETSRREIEELPPLF